VVVEVAEEVAAEGEDGDAFTDALHFLSWLHGLGGQHRLAFCITVIPRMGKAQGVPKCNQINFITLHQQDQR
jgi:hypothetical protein